MRKRSREEIVKDLLSLEPFIDIGYTYLTRKQVQGADPGGGEGKPAGEKPQQGDENRPEGEVVAEAAAVQPDTKKAEEIPQGNNNDAVPTEKLAHSEPSSPQLFNPLTAAALSCLIDGTTYAEATLLLRLGPHHWSHLHPDHVLSAIEAHFSTGCHFNSGQLSLYIGATRASRGVLSCAIRNQECIMKRRAMLLAGEAQGEDSEAPQDGSNSQKKPREVSETALVKPDSIDFYKLDADTTPIPMPAENAGPSADELPKGASSGKDDHTKAPCFHDILTIIDLLFSSPHCRLLLLNTEKFWFPLLLLLRGTRIHQVNNIIDLDAATRHLGFLLKNNNNNRGIISAHERIMGKLCKMNTLAIARSDQRQCLRPARCNPPNLEGEFWALQYLSVFFLSAALPLLQLCVGQGQAVATQPLLELLLRETTCLYGCSVMHHHGIVLNVKKVLQSLEHLARRSVLLNQIISNEIHKVKAFVAARAAAEASESAENNQNREKQARVPIAYPTPAHLAKEEDVADFLMQYPEVLVAGVDTFVASSEGDQENTGSDLSGVEALRQILRQHGRASLKELPPRLVHASLLLAAWCQLHYSVRPAGQVLQRYAAPHSRRVVQQLVSSTPRDAAPSRRDLLVTVHPHYHTNSSTGRIFATQPNVQTVPSYTTVIGGVAPAALNQTNVFEGGEGPDEKAITRENCYDKLHKALAQVEEKLLLRSQSDSSHSSQSANTTPSSDAASQTSSNRGDGLIRACAPIQVNYRSFFCAPPGLVLVSIDYNQIELRLLAHLSGDPALLRAFGGTPSVAIETCNKSGSAEVMPEVAVQGQRGEDGNHAKEKNQAPGAQEAQGEVTEHTEGQKEASGNASTAAGEAAPPSDVITFVASFLFSVPMASITPPQRRAAKEVTYGLIYGMGDSALQARIPREVAAMYSKEQRHPPTRDGSFAAAAALRRRFGEAFPRAIRYINTINDNIIITRCTPPTIGGRQRSLDEFYSGGSSDGAEDDYRYRYKFNISNRQLVSLLIQGSAADVLKGAIEDVLGAATRAPTCRAGSTAGSDKNHEGDPDRPTPPTPQYALLLALHDELIFAVPSNPDILSATISHLVGLMRRQSDKFALSVPLTVSVKVGPTMGDMTLFPQG